MAVSPRQARKALEAFKRGIPTAVLRGLRKGMPIAVRYATTKYMVRKDNRHPFKAYDPPNDPPGPLGIRQGNLARSVRLGDMRYTGTKLIASLVAGNDQVPYAKVHELGMTIRAKNGPDLIFFVGSPSGPRRIKVPAVVIKPRPYLTPALRDATPEIEKHVIAEITTLARATLKDVARFR